MRIVGLGLFPVPEERARRRRAREQAERVMAMVESIDSYRKENPAYVVAESLRAFGVDPGWGTTVEDVATAVVFDLAATGHLREPGVSPNPPGADRPEGR